MCHLISFVLPADAALDRVEAELGVGLQLLGNTKLQAQLAEHELDYCRKGQHCDCGTALGSKRASRKAAGKAELDALLAGIRRVLESGSAPYLGLLKHLYRGRFDSEAISLRDRVDVALETASRETLADVDEDTLYVFHAATR